VRILLGFLAAYVVLLVVFREVLFPFLMAIFLAYLIEPIVRWVKGQKLFGVDWGRGPIVVVLYALLVGGMAIAGWKAVTKAATTIRSTATDIAAALREEGGRAVFTLDRPEDGPHHDLIIEEGTKLLYGAAGKTLTYVTLHDARIPADASRVEVLLELSEAARGAPRPEEGAVLLLPSVASLRFVGADGSPPLQVEVKVGSPPRGSEIAFERRIVGPVVRNLASRGIEVEPTSLREFVAVKAQSLSEDLPDRVTRGAIGLAGKVVLSLYEFFLILMITAFIVMDRKTIATFFTGLAPEPYKPAYGKLMRYVDDGLAGVIRGQLVICVANGLLTWVGLLLLGVKGATWLALLASVLSLIPIFGTILSSIPIVVIAATDSVDKGILALLWIIFIHLVEANVLNPLIMGSHARMHPVIIIFALLAGEHYFGVWGALLAVPTASIVQSCFLFYLYEIEGLPPPPQDGGHGQGFRKLMGWVRRKLGKGAASTDAGSTA
jgi:predicted PurR-regulated permease PerM